MPASPGGGGIAPPSGMQRSQSVPSSVAGTPLQSRRSLFTSTSSDVHPGEEGDDDGGGSGGGGGAGGGAAATAQAGGAAAPSSPVAPRGGGGPSIGSEP